MSTAPPPPEQSVSFDRVLGRFSVLALGVGAIIGAGIFVRTGTAAAQYAGPSIVLSFLLAGLACLFTALCFAELASMYPVAGGAYAYARAAFGQPVAWIIGWSLILEYLIGASTASVGWSGYTVDLLRQLGVALPASLTHGPFMAEVGWQVTRVAGGVVDLPAVFLVVAITALLVAGIRVAANVNAAVVVVKVAIIVIVIVFGFAYVHPDNWHPFVPRNAGTFGRFGWSGVLRGAAVVSFSFLGFDAVSVFSQEARNPQRDVPLGIVGSLGICTALYILMAVVMTGLTPYPDLNAPHPVFAAMSAAPGLQWMRGLIGVAVVLGLGSVVLVMLMAQPRIVVAMANDGLLPLALGQLHPRFRSPIAATLVTGVVAAAIAGFAPIGLLGDLLTAGTLTVFVAVCAGVLVLRYNRPDLQRPFRAPLGPVVPVLGIVSCVGLMASLLPGTWVRLVVWIALGLAIYFLYGARNSRRMRATIVGAD